MDKRLIGYARISTISQNEDRQMIALQKYGVSPKHIYLDRASGKDFDRRNYKRMLKRLKKGNILVALAGPMANFITAFIAMFLMVLLYKLNMGMSLGVKTVLSMIVLFNINFGIFNLIPLPPLDGSKILMEFLPSEYAYKYMGIERYSFIILIVMMMTPILSGILIPLSRFMIGLFESVITLILL